MRYTVTSIAALLLSLSSFAQAPITGTLSLCPGTTTTLSDATPGGSWSSSNPSVATIGAVSGMVTSGSVGTTTISYTVSGSAVTAVVTVNPVPLPITGALAVCVGSTTTAFDATTGGTWSDPSYTIYATIGSTTGIVTGRAAGTATITYTAATGCHVSAVVTINPLPTPVASSTGTFRLCNGDALTLGSSPAGGVWSGSPSGIATIGSSTGVLTGTSAGTFVATYTDAHSCFITATLTVDPLPLPIVGPPSVPAGGTALYTDATSGGLWSSSNMSVATIGPSSGVATGVSTGSTIISYCISATGCCTSTAVTASSALPVNCVAGNNYITVFPNPTSGALTINWAMTATSKADIIVTDILGREVHHSQPDIDPVSRNSQLQLSYLTSGMYFLRVHSGTVSHTEKIMIR